MFVLPYPEGTMTLILKYEIPHATPRLPGDWTSLFGSIQAGVPGIIVTMDRYVDVHTYKSFNLRVEAYADIRIFICTQIR